MTDPKTNPLQTLFFLLGTFSDELKIIGEGAFKDFGRKQLKDFIGNLVIDAGERIKTIDWNSEQFKEKFGDDKFSQVWTEKVNFAMTAGIQLATLLNTQSTPETPPAEPQKSVVDLCNALWKSLSEVQLSEMYRISLSHMHRIHNAVTEPIEEILIDNFKKFKESLVPEDIKPLGEIYSLLTDDQKEIVNSIINKV